jgi:hypothetical protein
MTRLTVGGSFETWAMGSAGNCNDVERGAIPWASSVRWAIERARVHLVAYTASLPVACPEAVAATMLTNSTWRRAQAKATLFHAAGSSA